MCFLSRVFIFLLCSLVSVCPAGAVVIQILHTNDLHAAMKSAGTPKAGEPEFGGWAQVKARLDQLTEEARVKGIETVKLDAGDYIEGSSYYFPDNGIHVLQAFQDIGYDAVTVGNHDWLMGASDMNSLYAASPFKFPVVATNIHIRRHLRTLRNQIRQHAQIVRSGVRIGIMGLATDEALYSWIPSVKSHRDDFVIRDFKDQTEYDEEEDEMVTQPGLANRTIDRLNRSNDVVIALTHIGFSEDKLLAAHSKGLDLVIGGHSHTVLESMAVVPNAEGREVPVVQAGFNGKYIGRIFLEVEKGKDPRVLSYELVPISNQGAKDPTQEAHFKIADEALEKLYGPRLREPIGKSEVRLISGSQGPTAYSKFVVDAMRDITNADLALDVGAFHGNTPQPAGEVTRYTLMELYPRKFEQEQNEGLYVYQGQLPGIAIKVGLEYTMRFGIYLAFSGLTFDLGRISDADYEKLKRRYVGTAHEHSITPYYPRNIKVNGQPIRTFHWYNTATTESLVRGAFGVTPLAKLVFRRSRATPHTLWDTMNYYLLKEKVIKALSPGDHFDAGEFNQDYQERIRNKEIQDQYAEGELVVAPWLRETHIDQKLIEEGFSEMIKELQ